MIIIVMCKQNSRYLRKKKTFFSFRNLKRYFSEFIVIEIHQTNQCVNRVFFINNFHKFFEKINNDKFSNNVKKITLYKRFSIDMKFCFHNSKQF